MLRVVGSMQRMDTEVFSMPDRKTAGQILFAVGLLYLVIREGLMQGTGTDRFR